MSEVAEVHSIGAKTLTSRLAKRFGVDENKMIAALKATAFSSAKSITNEQMMALCIVSEQYGLNPWTKEIYAFPDKSGGIIPVVGVDGWARIINSHPEFDGMDFEQDDDKCTCVIYRKDRAHPIKVTEYMEECRRPSVGPWQSHPRRMLRHKAMIQCARIAFSFAGIYDPDEGERIIEAEVVSTQRPSISARAAALEGETWDTVKCSEYVDELRRLMPDKENIDYAGVNQLREELRSQGPLYIAVCHELESWQRTAIRKSGEISKEPQE